MDAELKSLRIDRTAVPAARPGRRWAAPAGAAFLLLGAGAWAFAQRHTAVEVETVRVSAAPAGGGEIVLNATGYIVAAHKIELASKVVGKVAWIGVEKGDRVTEGQPLVRLEDDEYRAHVLEAQGQLAGLEARLAELSNGSRPEEIAKADADLAQSRADLENARASLARTRQLETEGVLAKQALDDAQARYDSQAARTASLERVRDLVRIGPRREQIDAARAQVRQVQGTLDYARTMLENTVIHAPVSGTILERNVEKGEFVTTGFVGDRGAKGYVVSIANLKDLEVELDISQSDFARLQPRHPATITTDAYPDRKYRGYISEIAPEANRQKATVQVKVKILDPDDSLRPDMNASVAFGQPGDRPSVQAKPSVAVPPAAVKDGAVFVLVEGKAVRRPVAALIGGEDVIVKPLAELKDGQRVRTRKDDDRG